MKRKKTLLVILLLAGITARSQVTDTLQTLTALHPQYDSAEGMVYRAIVFKKIKGRRVFTRHVDTKLFIRYTPIEIQKPILVKARIGQIKSDSAVVVPYSKKLYPQRLALNDMHYAEFYTGLSIPKGVIVNSVNLITTVGIVALDVVIFATNLVFTIVTLGKIAMLPVPLFEPFIILPWDNFRRHLRVINRKGVRKWEVQAI